MSQNFLAVTTRDVSNIGIVTRKSKDALNFLNPQNVRFIILILFKYFDYIEN